MLKRIRPRRLKAAEVGRMKHAVLEVGRHGYLVLPKQTMREMGVGAGEKVRITYNPDFGEWVVRPLKQRNTRGVYGQTRVASKDGKVL